MSVYCLDALDFLAGINTDSVDMILTDPPYGTTRETFDQSLDEDYKDRLAEEIVRVVATETGAVFIFIPIQDINGWMKRMKKLGMKHIRTGVWLKTNAMFNRQPYPSNALEYWLYCDKRTNPKYGKIVFPVYECTNTQRLPEWETGNRHRFSKPISLIRTVIHNHSNEGDTVCDPFTGSGYTGVSSLLENRNYLINDINPDFVEKVRQRVDMYRDFEGHLKLEDRMTAAASNETKSKKTKKPQPPRPLSAIAYKSIQEAVFEYSVLKHSGQTWTEDQFLAQLRGERGAKKGDEGYDAAPGLSRNTAVDKIWRAVTQIVSKLNNLNLADSKGAKISFSSAKRGKDAILADSQAELVKRFKLKLLNPKLNMSAVKKNASKG